MNESKDEMSGYDKCVHLQGSERTRHAASEFFDVWSTIMIKQDSNPYLQM